MRPKTKTGGAKTKKAKNGAKGLTASYNNSAKMTLPKTKGRAKAVALIYLTIKNLILKKKLNCC